MLRLGCGNLCAGLRPEFLKTSCTTHSLIVAHYVLNLVHGKTRIASNLHGNNSGVWTHTLVTGIMTHRKFEKKIGRSLPCMGSDFPTKGCSFLHHFWLQHSEIADAFILAAQLGIHCLPTRTCQSSSLPQLGNHIFLKTLNFLNMWWC